MLKNVLLFIVHFYLSFARNVWPFKWIIALLVRMVHEQVKRKSRKVVTDCGMATAIIVLKMLCLMKNF